MHEFFVHTIHPPIVRVTNLNVSSSVTEESVAKIFILEVVTEGQKDRITIGTTKG